MQLLSALETHANDATADGRLAHAVGLPLGKAIAARAHGNHRATAEMLDALRYDIVQIGGSNAQRELFTQLHLDAHLRAGNRRSAIRLLAERLGARPGDVIAQQRLQQLIAQSRHG